MTNRKPFQLEPGETVSEHCHKTREQDCSHCEDTSCGDNTNPKRNKKATKKATKEYVANGGTWCPYCGFGQLEGNGLEVEEGFATQYMKCLRCHRRWTDVYRLVGFKEAE
jgi:hypothetical protein